MHTITSVGGELWIDNNDQLQDLSPLENIQSIGGNSILGNSLFILNNGALQSLTGLENIAPASILDLNIYNNPQLSECDVSSICDYLADPSGTVDIHDNATGCNSLQQVEDSCETLQCLPEGITFTTQAEVDDFPVNYPDCEEIEGFVHIGVNPANDISNLDGLNNITSIGGDLSISHTSLTSFEGLHNIETIGGQLSIFGNTEITNLESFGNLSYTGGGINIGTVMLGPMGLLYVGNNNLENLNGLNNLGGINGSLSVISNVSLTSILALENITSIAGFIWIDHNSLLAELEGLSNIDAGSIDSLRIMNNPALSSCEAQSVCDYLASPNANIIIFDNAPGCNSPEEVQAACEGVSVEEQGGLEVFSVWPNPCSDAANLEFVISDKGTVISELFTITGKKILELLNEEKLPGTHEMHIDSRDLPSGIYYCVLRTSSGTLTTKLIKL